MATDNWTIDERQWNILKIRDKYYEWARDDTLTRWEVRFKNNVNKWLNMPIEDAFKFVRDNEWDIFMQQPKGIETDETSLFYDPSVIKEFTPEASEYFEHFVKKLETGEASEYEQKTLAKLIREFSVEIY
jgi:hypothetical protein